VNLQVKPLFFFFGVKKKDQDVPMTQCVREFVGSFLSFGANSTSFCVELVGLNPKYLHLHYTTVVDYQWQRSEHFNVWPWAFSSGNAVKSGQQWGQ
jgi:hypothetical protein